MTGGPIMGGHDHTTPWLRNLAAAMLDCALLPMLDVDQAETMLASVAVLDAGDSREAGSLQTSPRGFALRAMLIATAESLLDRADPAAAGSRWRQSTLALALAEQLLGLAEAGRSDLNAARMRYALGPATAEPPDQLAADMRHYRDEPLDLLADAHLLVRLAASAWRLTNDAGASLSAVAALLELDVASLAARVQGTTAWEPRLAAGRSEFALRRSIDRFRSLEATLLPLADATSPDVAMTALERLLPRWLGQQVLPLWATGDGKLTVQGSSDLAGQRLRLHGSLSLAAMAATRNEVTVQRLTAPDFEPTEVFPPGGRELEASANVSVFDRQCAERLSVSALLALPVGAPEAIAVLLMGAGVDADDLKLVRIQVARWLTRFAELDQRLQHASTEQQGRFTRRMREAIHEISNPLSVMQNYLHLLGTRIHGDEPAQQQVRLISDELRRATSLLRGLADEERMDTVAVAAEQVGDVNALVSDVLALVELSLAPGMPTDIRFTPGTHLPAIAAAEGRLRQVLLNLTKNAVESMPNGGVLEVVVDQAVTDRGRRGVEIRVSDTGGGIDPALLGQIFESGVSVKGEGRGLGLAITSRLVNELGGQISCRSRVGAGTSFVVWLPVA